MPKNSPQKIIKQKQVGPSSVEQKTGDLSEKLANFLNGKGGQAGCKRRNFKKRSKS